MADSHQSPDNGSASSGSLSQSVSQAFFGCFKERIGRVTMDGLIRHGLDPEIVNAVVSALNALHGAGQLTAARFGYVVDTNVSLDDRVKFLRNVPLFAQHSSLRHHGIISKVADDQQQQLWDDLTARTIVEEVIRFTVIHDEELAYRVLKALTTRQESADAALSLQDRDTVPTSSSGIHHSNLPLETPQNTQIQFNISARPGDVNSHVVVNGFVNTTQTITKKRQRSPVNEVATSSKRSNTLVDKIDPLLQSTTTVPSTNTAVSPGRAIQNQAKPSKMVKLVYKKSNKTPRNSSSSSNIPSDQTMTAIRPTQPLSNDQTSTPSIVPLLSPSTSLLPPTHRYYCSLCGCTFRKVPDLNFHWKKDHILTSKRRDRLMTSLQNGKMGPWTPEEAKNHRATRKDLTALGTCELPAPSKIKKAFHVVYKRNQGDAEKFARKYSKGLINGDGDEILSGRK